MGAAVLHLRGTYFAVLTFGMTELIRHAVTYFEKQRDRHRRPRAHRRCRSATPIYLTVLALAVLSVAAVDRRAPHAASGWRWPASAPTSSARRRWA